MVQLCLPLSDMPQKGVSAARAARQRAFLSGKIVHGGGAYSIDCAIRNISHHGAMISIARHQTLPPEIYLIAVKHGLAHQAKVAWYNYPARGLHFLQTFAMAADSPDELRFLRRLWVELSARSGSFN
jgi:hypothetical protein